MALAILVLIFVLNLGITIVNLFTVGHAWVEAKHRGGMALFIEWLGLIMTAAGFTWCLMVVEGVILASVKKVPDEFVEAFFSLGYLTLIFPIIGAGIGITMNMWARAYRTRAFGDYAVAGYDSLATGYNVYNAIGSVGPAWRSVNDSLIKNLFRNKDTVLVTLVIVLAAVAVFGGILITWIGVKRIAASEDPIEVGRRGDERRGLSDRRELEY